ncbi:type II secretion system minor pseudopilin GspK [Alcaligenaceae bacterium CGII-47]|nr:type II secretion system minor pseudopilin GspK [Alcaligenaceae bacterium CGII-47]
MAVIAALVVVLAASVMATSVIERQGVLASVLMTERQHAQASWLLQGGLDWSRVILQMDARDNATTRQDGIWAHAIIGLPVGASDDPQRALFSGQIEDAQSKFNLRTLAQGGQIQPDARQRLGRLLQSLGFDPSLAHAMAQRVADAQFAGDLPPRATGLRSIHDLQSLDAFDAPTLDALQAYLTYIPVITPINANTASAQVLAAVITDLGLAGARELVAQRERGMWFTNHGDMVNRISGLTSAEAKRLSVRSDWFHVRGEVSVDGTMLGLEALLHRDRLQLPTIHWVSY